MNDVVWAKIRYCPYWPAKIVDETPPEIGPTPANTQCVYFFGSKNFGFPRIENVRVYAEHRLKYVKKGRGQLFKSAVEECDNYISGNNNSSLGDSAMAVGNQIVVKRELDFNVKSETDDNAIYSTESFPIVRTENSCNECRVKQIEINKLKNEKCQITQDFLATKKEHQETYLSFKQNERLLYKAQKDLAIYKTKFSVLNLKCVALEGKLSAMNEVLDNVARHPLGQLNSSNASENIYDVEKILRHKQNKGQLSFLVRWEGYSEKYDSWVRENDIFSGSLLEEYKKQNGLH